MIIKHKCAYCDRNMIKYKCYWCKKSISKDQKNEGLYLFTKNFKYKTIRYYYCSIKCKTAGEGGE